MFGQRIDAGDVAADRVDPVRGDDVVGKRIAHDASRCVEAGGQRIVDGNQVAAPVPVVAEIPEARRGGGNGVDRRDAAPLLDPGVVGEEERAAVAVIESRNHESAAEGAAELVPIERRHRDP